jgi:hypothetical protein
MDPSCTSEADTGPLRALLLKSPVHPLCPSRYSGNLGRSWPEAVMFGRSARSARAMLVGCRAAASNTCANGRAGSWLLRCKTRGRHHAIV